MKKTVFKVATILLVSVAVFKGAGFSAADGAELVGFDGQTVKETFIDSDRFAVALESGKYISPDVLNQARIYCDYDPEEQIVSLSDGINIVRYYLNDRFKKVNGQESAMNNEVKLVGASVAISTADIANIFGIKILINPNTSRILVVNDKDGYKMGHVASITSIKDKPDELGSEMARISPDQQLYLGETSNGWTKVVSDVLEVGYIKSESINATLVPRSKYVPATRPGKINLTWEQVSGKNPNMSAVPAMQGVNVISPTWFSLVKDNGSYKGKENLDYIRWANTNGYELWPLANNAYNKDMSKKFLYSAQSRERYIEQLLQTYTNLGFKGINIDFENMYGVDKDQYTKFISELTSRFRKEGMVVSVDVTFTGGSDTWSRCYDRQALGMLVDYVMVMAYDETGASSQTSGSVASFGWVDRKMKDMVKLVPSEKIVMGMPFYTRVWTETPSSKPGKKVDVKSSAVSMKFIQELLVSKNLVPVWDDKAKQNFVTYMDKNAVKKIWIEDSASLREKMTVQRDMRLAGVASWRRGYETPDIWGLIDTELKN